MTAAWHGMKMPERKSWKPDGFSGRRPRIWRRTATKTVPASTGPRPRHWRMRPRIWISRYGRPRAARHPCPFAGWRIPCSGPPRISWAPIIPLKRNRRLLWLRQSGNRASMRSCCARSRQEALLPPRRTRRERKPMGLLPGQRLPGTRWNG